MTEKIPISGGPHTGKTTLLEALRDKFPTAYFVPEPATAVIDRELAIEQNNPGYIPRVPWIDYSQFGPLVADESEALEMRIPTTAAVAFQDRSLVDTIAYCRINDFEDFIPEVRGRIALARYSFALICQPVGLYTATDIRRESQDEALATHAEIQRAYGEFGLEVISIPAIPIEERVDLISEVLEGRGIV